MNIKQRLLILAALAVLTTAGAVQAQARAWGFSKDTVYEWAAGGDSVRLVNSGSDTLRLDSLALELVRPTANRYDMRYDITLPGASTSTQHYLPYVAAQNPWRPFGVKIGAGQSGLFSRFIGEINLVPVVKQAAINKGDTVVMRLIFRASGLQGRDTLTFLSVQSANTALYPALLHRKSANRAGPLYDLRGRRAEPLPQGARVPFRPVVTGKKN